MNFPLRSISSVSDRPSLLHIGTDRYVLRSCVRNNIWTVALCGPGPWDNGIVRVPEQITLLRVDDQCNPECALGALHRAGLGSHRFDAVQTTFEYSLVTAGVIASALGCRGVDPVTALYFRDKRLQKERVRRAGVPAARTMVIDDIYDVSAIPELEFPRAVLKPVAGAGTAHTRVIKDVGELKEASEAWRRAGISTRTFLLEEFIEGEEWIADGVVYDGELIFYALARYGEPCLTTVQRQLPLWQRRFDPETESWAYSRADPVVRRSVAALGPYSGVFHMELFHDPRDGSVTFSECAARRGGALVQEELQAKFAVDLGDCAVQCALGRHPELSVKIRDGVIGGTYLLGPAGTLISCPSPAELRELPGVEFVRMDHPFGTRLSGRIADTTQKLGQVLLSADSVPEFTERAEQIRTWFTERLLVAPADVTPRDLRAWHAAHWPEADFSDALIE
jgi:biotin carboxylase